MVIRLMIMSTIPPITITSSSDIDSSDKTNTSGTAQDIQYSIVLYISAVPSVRHATGCQESDKERMNMVEEWLTAMTPKVENGWTKRSSGRMRLPNPHVDGMGGGAGCILFSR